MASRGDRGLPLHGPGVCRKEGAVVEHSGFEPCPQLAPQVWTRREFSEEGVMREAVEAFFDVGVQDIFGFLAHGRENRCNRSVAGTPGAKAIAVGFEARLPFGCQGAFDEGVAGSIGHGWDAEWSLLRRAWFRDPDAADRGGRAIEDEGLRQGEALGGW